LEVDATEYAGLKKLVKFWHSTNAKEEAAKEKIAALPASDLKAKAAEVLAANAKDGMAVTWEEASAKVMPALEAAVAALPAESTGALPATERTALEKLTKLEDKRGATRHPGGIPSQVRDIDVSKLSTEQLRVVLNFYDLSEGPGEDCVERAPAERALRKAMAAKGHCDPIVELSNAISIADGLFAARGRDSMNQFGRRSSPFSACVCCFHGGLSDSDAFQTSFAPSTRSTATLANFGARGG